MNLISQSEDADPPTYSVSNDSQNVWELIRSADLQRQRNSNLQEQLNLLSSELIKHKKCILALLEANFETMTRLMNELKPNENTDGEDDETENEN